MMTSVRMQKVCVDHLSSQFGPNQQDYVRYFNEEQGRQMTQEKRLSPGESTTVNSGSVVIKVEAGQPGGGSFGRKLLFVVLLGSIALNLLFLMFSSAGAQSSSSGVQFAHRSGSKGAPAKLAVINFSGTIMPPFTERWLKQIKAATEDPEVKGVLLAIDSPGGLVADSHQLYHELQKLKQEKPVFVSMKRMAASGGYYIAMSGGTESQVFAEPTTWTGSIGVIIPRYNAGELGKTIGVKVEPLVTGPLKDSLNPFRDLTDREKEVWAAILDDSFTRFVGVISDNRPSLNEEQVRELATGQIYTANQALESGLVDQIGYEEDALKALASSLQLTDYEVVAYASTPGLIDILLSTAEAKPSPLDQLLSSSVPRAMYYCSWSPWIPGTPQVAQ